MWVKDVWARVLKELTVYEEVFTHRAVEPSGKAMPLKPVVDGNVQAPRLCVRVYLMEPIRG